MMRPGVISMRAPPDGANSTPGWEEVLEGVTGIEPAQSVWKTETLPLSYTPGPSSSEAGRDGTSRCIHEHT
ncbi:hypothetical protein MICRO8M_80164 [Microbacterium sp. 8M]|nr:hypothetical protein MICRO8M_80164 [Microbacterium sp. 8M]